MKEFSAVSLEYNENDTAPKITAKGKDKIAERILRIAEEAEIPVVNDSDLAAVLYKFDIGDYISEEIYDVVVDLFVFLYKLNGKLK